MMIGIEIEFISNDYLNIFTILKENNINFIFSPYCKYSDKEHIILKPESTVKGMELNISPNNLNQLKKICNLLKPNTYFNNKCALHIHISDDSINLDKVYDYYINNESNIIEECKKKNLYLNLNKSLNYFSKSQLQYIRKTNINIYNSYNIHKTIEHRIYKATFDYDSIMWCINQTIKIIDSIK